jgi:hypothetical protein
MLIKGIGTEFYLMDMIILATGYWFASHSAEAMLMRIILICCFYTSLKFMDMPIFLRAFVTIIIIIVLISVSHIIHPLLNIF